MDALSIVIAVVGCIATIFGGWGAFAYFRLMQRDTSQINRKAEIAAQLTAALIPVNSDIREMQLRLEQRDALIKVAIHEAMEPIRDQLSALNTKVDPLWRALEQLAINSANVLHHPDPRRAEIDRLLDHFKDDILTPEEELALRRYLVAIKDWEPGQDLGFPVYQGEPSSAANLLSMLDLVRIYRQEKRKR